MDPSLRKPRPAPLVGSELEESDESLNWSTSSDFAATHKITGITIKRNGTFGVDNSDGVGDYLVSRSDFELDEYNPIGFGRSSTVYRARHICTGLIFAIKEIFFGDKTNRDQLSAEVVVWNLEGHCPMLLQFFGAYVAPSNNSVHLVLEYMEHGSLDDLTRLPLLNSASPTSFVPERYLKFIAFQVIDGLLYLHEKNCIHRDVKPHNILISRQGSIKLSDFGISRNVAEEAAGTFVGTKTYMSPERIRGRNYAAPADVWSFGIVLYELATSQHPFQYDDFWQLVHIDELPEAHLPDNGCYSDELRDFLAQCLQSDPIYRYSARQLLNHDFLRYGMCSRMEFVEWLQDCFNFFAFPS